MESKDNTAKQMLLSCGVESLNEQVIDELKPKGYSIVVARNSKAIIEKLTQLKPPIIVADVQMDAISVKEITAAVKAIEAYEPKILLFSFFMRIDAAENSEKHYFYTHFLDGQFEGMKDIYYMGAFSKESAKETFLKALVSQLNLKK